mgnify:CR=1 FL=1
MKLDKETINAMSIPELKKTLAQLKKEDKYPHLATLIAYVLTYHYYYKRVNKKKAKQFYDETMRLLDIPSGYSWCYISVHMLAGISMPHYLHAEVVKKRFPRLARTRR